MDRYFLHVRDGTHELLDEEGVEYRNLGALHKGVLEAVRDLIAGEALQGAINLKQRLDAENGDGEIVYTLEFEDAVTVSRGPSGGLAAG